MVWRRCGVAAARVHAFPRNRGTHEIEERTSPRGEEGRVRKGMGLLYSPVQTVFHGKRDNSLRISSCINFASTLHQVRASAHQ